jgi:hypothetical protein
VIHIKPRVFSGLDFYLWVYAADELSESNCAHQNGLRASNDRRIDHLPIQHKNASINLLPLPKLQAELRRLAS